MRKPVVVGEKYGGLTVIASPTYKICGNHTEQFAVCKCECGTEKIIRVHDMRDGRIVSCGCRKRSRFSKLIHKHGLRNHPLYHKWLDIKQRCTNPSNNQYRNYGGRGIAMCKEWIDDPANFIEWAMHNGWSQGLQIDRIDTNGDYSPDNCRFVTALVNANNKRNTIMVTVQGVVMPIMDAMRKYKIAIPYETIYGRIKRGFDFEHAANLISAPLSLTPAPEITI